MKTAIEGSNEKRVFKKNNDFRSFLNVLEKENDLIRINKTVSTKFEIGSACKQA